MGNKGLFPKMDVPEGKGLEYEGARRAHSSKEFLKLGDLRGAHIRVRMHKRSWNVHGAKRL